MPAPVVYVLAIVGTVGAALAFKEFVYEPHIAPAIDRWKAEYQAAREARRRREQFDVLQDVDDMQMSEPRKRGILSDKYSDDESSDDGREDFRKKATTSSHSVMRDGLLIRQPVSDKGDVELDNLVAHEVNEWRNHFTGQVLRQRNNVSEYNMDESIQPISPSRTHVLIDSSAPSPSTPAHSRLPTPPPEAKPQHTTTASPKPIQHVPTAPKHASPLRGAGHPLDQVDHEAQGVFSPSSGAPPSAPSPSITSPLHAPTHHPYPQIVPSLSQSYPQDLDYEHDLELLSPPSSRAESPFVMATRTPPARGIGRPASSVGSQSTSDLSFAVVSPRSPLRMGLGNDSYDAISPVPDFQTLSGSRVTDSPAHSRPNLSGSASAHGEPSSEHPTPSSQESAYLSFEDSDEEEEGPAAQPYAHLAGLGMSGSAIPSSSTSQQQSQSTLTLLNHQPAGLHYSLVQGPYHTSPAPPNTTQLDTSQTRSPAAGAGTASPSASASFSGKDGPPSLLLSATPTLFPVPPRAPYTPSPPAHPKGVAAASHTANAAVALPAGGRDPSYFRPSSRTQAHDVSDSELSDLDFISDYAPSESDIGNESDASWGVLGRGSAGVRR